MREPVPAKLRFNGAGQLLGRPGITYNQPWPCVNGSPGGSAPDMMGVVLHTEDGYEGGTIAWFNNPAAQASAFFAVGKDGAIHQFGPVGKDWMAWAQEDGNPMWYSIEDADNGHPSTPFTWEQVKALAQIAEALSEYAGFPLEVTDSPAGKGVGIHSMGGQAWGGHLQCPGLVRAAQRAHIIGIAELIRNPQEGVALVKPKRKPVRTTVKRARKAVHKKVVTEPVVTHSAAAGGLMAAVVTLASHVGLHLTAKEMAAVLTGLPALFAFLAAFRVRTEHAFQVAVAGLAAAGSTAALAFGYAIPAHVPLTWIGSSAPVIAAGLAYLLRGQVSPKATPAPATAAVQATTTLAA